MITSRRDVFAILIAMMAMATPALAGEIKIIDAPSAYSSSQSGNLLILDVRSPQEWQATGIPAGAKAVTIHDPDGLRGFAIKASQLIGTDPGRPVALICAAGNRSTRASDILRQVGYTNIYNIKEGMMGRNVTAHPKQMGWIKHGLPIEQVK